MMYFSGQGKVYIGQRDVNGNPQGLTYVGNVAKLMVSPNVTTLEHQESTSGQRLVDLQLVTGKKAMFDAMLEDIQSANLALALYGTANTVVGGVPVTGEVLPTGVTVGPLYLLKVQNVTAVSIQDSTGTPKTLPPAGYTVNAAAGSITFTDITTGGPYVQPFKVTYTPGPSTNTIMFTQPLPERWVRFEGLNTANSNSSVIVDLYRVAMLPVKQFDLISNTLMQLELAGTTLADLGKASDPTLGIFGRIITI
ncbi:MAG: hypothetical protein KGI52_07070 [Burkholderiales bacterium]|nr:hypothetical protein [Burkholderiales bacterium]